MFAGPSLLAICVFAAVMAMPLGVVVCAGALAVPQRRRRHVLLGTAVAALLAPGAAMLLPLDVVRVGGAALLVVGMVAASAASVLILLRKDGNVPAGVVGLTGAVLVTAGHLMGTAPILAALGSPGARGGAGELLGQSSTVLLSGLGTAAVTVLVVVAALLLLLRLFAPIRGGIALGALAAVLATGTQLVLADLGTQVPTLTVTALGLVLGTLLGAMGADRSGALAGMPPGNH